MVDEEIEERGSLEKEKRNEKKSNCNAKGPQKVGGREEENSRIPAQLRSRTVSQSKPLPRRHRVAPSVSLAGHPLVGCARNALRERHSLPLATPATPPERHVGTLCAEPRNPLCSTSKPFVLNLETLCAQPRNPLFFRKGTPPQC